MPPTPNRFTPPSNDPFADETPQSPKPSARATPRRASEFMPTEDQFYLKDIEGRQVLICTITPGVDTYGDCVDMLVTAEGDEEAFVVHVSGYLAGKLIVLQGQIEAGECDYPLAAKFDKVQIGGGKMVWKIS